MNSTHFKEIDYPIEAKLQSAPYKIHKYWGRKPWNIVSEYIDKYTKEGDIILDPYVGGGTTAYEAIKAKRKVIAFDINPVATFITRCTLESINTFDYELEFEKIKNDIKDEIEKLYFTRCKRCGKKAVIKETIWQRDGLKETPLQITYRCVCSRLDLVKKKEKIDKKDIDSIRRINELPIPFWHPKYIEVPRHVKVYKPTKETKRDIHQFFTHRNIIALSYLKNAIGSIQDKSIKNMMLYAFSASIAHSSKLISIKKWKKRRAWQGSSWIVPGLYVLKQNCERNVWYNFEIKFRKILKTKSENFNDTIFYKPANSYEELMNGKGTAWIETRPADKLEDIPDKGIDFVFADPPYHEDIFYLAQSGIFGSWLGMGKELSESKSSALVIKENDNIAGSNAYYEMIQSHFSKISKKISSANKIIVAFESYDPRKWDNLIKSIMRAGTKCESIVYHPQPVSFGKAFRYSHKKKFSKPPILGTYYMRLVPETNMDSASLDKKLCFETTINQKIMSILQQRNETTSLSVILKYLYCALPKEKIITMQQSLVEKINSISNASFIIKDSQVSMKSGNIPSSGKSLSELVKERIKRIIVQEGEGRSSKINNLVAPFFVKEKSIDYSYVGDKIHELKEEDYLGYSREKVYSPSEKLINMGIEREHALFYLLRIGKKFGLGVWIGEKYHDTKLDVENIADLYNADKNKAKALLKDRKLYNELDVIWIKKNRPIYHFEIQEENEKISRKAIEFSDELSNKFSGVRRIIIGSNRLCDLIRTQKKGWGYWDCLTFKDLEYYYSKEEESISNISSLDNFKEENKIFQEIGKVRFKSTDYKTKKIGKEARHCTLNFLSPKITKIIKPGQFIALLCNPNVEIERRGLSLEKMTGYNNFKITSYKDLFLLRRPFSVHRIYYMGFKRKYLKRNDGIPADFLDLLKGGYKDSFDVLFKIAGRGTERLAQMKIGEKISILGPLGNGINVVPLNTKVAYLVAGGIGIAPLYSIAERLRWLGIKVKLIAGAEEKLPRNRTHVDPSVEEGYKDNRYSSLTTEFKEIGCEVHTVLASQEEKTAVVKLERVIERDKRNKKLDATTTRIYSCGPWSMLKGVAEVAKYENIECEILLEKRMGCGIGTCLSCVCDVYKRKNGQYSKDIVHKRVCYDGPVFNSKEVKW
ncbi:MAG: DNA adenine methylase [Candidatus Omnitrophica bacterium]|nr:DNA adenine methylase [Candidatus Omnitrophota bacterium]